MYKTIIIFLVMSCVLFLPQALIAKYNTSFPMANIEIGIIDIKKLLDETGVANQAMAKINNKFAAENKALVEEQYKLQDEIKKINQSGSKLKADELEKLKNQIVSQQKQLQNIRKDLQSRVSAAQNLETQSLVVRFLAIVSKIALRKNIDLILFKDIIIYQNNARTDLDLTDETIKLYSNDNSRNKK